MPVSLGEVLRSVVSAALQTTSVSGLLHLSVAAMILAVTSSLGWVLWRRAQLRCFAEPPKRNFLLGHMGMMRSNEEGLQAVDQLVRTYHHSCVWFLGPVCNLVRLFHPDYVKSMLLAPASITYKDELFYGLMRPWLGQSLLLSNGTEWARQRRLLTPAFHFGILKSYIHIFNQSSNTMHAKWHRLVAEGKTSLDMFNHISLMTLDSLLKCTFSYNSNCQERPSEYISAIFELSELVVQRQRFVPYHWDWLYWRCEAGRRFRRACAVVHGFTADVMQKRRAEIEQRGPPEGHAADADTSVYKKKMTDFVDILLLSKDEEGNSLSEEEIKAQADTFMFAGHDTSASGISWVLYNLAQHPEYQERCRSEINTLLDGREVEEIVWDDLSRLPFTTMCIKESLRLHPPVAAITRYYSQDMAVPGGRNIPKGNICLLSIYGIHHNPDIWPDPEVYNPMRFDPDNMKGRSSHAFIPFSAGPRNCIGQNFAMAEIRVVLALTLRKFRLVPTGTPIRRLYTMVMRAEGGLPLRVEPLTG